MLQVVQTTTHQVITACQISYNFDVWLYVGTLGIRPKLARRVGNIYKNDPGVVPENNIRLILVDFTLTLRSVKTNSSGYSATQFT